jgi:hypothetical protein
MFTIYLPNDCTFVISQSLSTIPRGIEAIFQSIIRYSNTFLLNSTDIQYTLVKGVFIRKNKDVENKRQFF